ncbi:MAG: DUF4982 domain-containing protein [Alistipes sp.]|nr:DUF4982 domain-containing protein [Alistipes sp.]
MINKITTVKLIAAACLLANAFTAAAAEPRTEVLLEKGWRFTREDNPGFSAPQYNDKGWQSVTVPHDWAIYGPFGINNDMQSTAILQDGQTEAMEHAGRTGGLPFVGTGWYRLRFEVPDFYEGKRAELLFDGAMSHAHIYINGHEVGYWPYGYNSFRIDITPYITTGENLLAVRLENLPESSRWYPGAGLYRNVHLIVTQQTHIPLWGMQITADRIGDGYAEVSVRTPAALAEGSSFTGCELRTCITAPDGTTVASGTLTGGKYDERTFVQRFVVENPELWSPDTPALYTLTAELYEDGVLRDRCRECFGIRTVEVVPDKGFLLNGKPVKFHGVCNHHDLGPLGAAVNEAAIRYRIALLKDMGCNAIRTSHNMPSPELVKICDEMGMMLMAESLDEWRAPKVKNGYNLLYDEWVERDMTNLVLHYRNHPSVVMWCIGNEVSEQWHEVGTGAKIAHRLQAICHREDPTRPVTLGMDAPDAVTSNNMAAVVDIPGFNYRPFKYDENYRKLPQRVILGSETASTLSSRGVYKFPVERRQMMKYDDHQASSYDVEHCGWSNLPEDDFIWHDDREYCMGEFVWTGFDYLGEPTPYYSDWPSHSSLFGIIDLASLPKDRYWLYRSHWNPDAETLHILPHWTWPGREGETTPVFVYTNYPSAELFVNGKSQGVRTKDMTVTIENSADSLSTATFKRQQRYRLMWNDVRYEPGTLRVVAYDADGNPTAEKEVRTAGRPYSIVLKTDRTNLTADGRDLAFVTVSVVDKDGNPCPSADNEITFKVKGCGVYRAGANGNPASLESFQRPQMKLFSGMMTVLIGSTEDEGEIVVEASARGLKKCVLKLQSSK